MLPGGDKLVPATFQGMLPPGKERRDIYGDIDRRYIYLSLPRGIKNYTRQFPARMPR